MPTPFFNVLARDGYIWPLGTIWALFSLGGGSFGKIVLLRTPPPLNLKPLSEWCFLGEYHIFLVNEIHSPVVNIFIQKNAS